MKKFLIKFWPIICIVALWFIFASPYFLKGLIPFPSKYLVTFFPPWSASYGMPVKNNAMPDVITQIYPWKKLTIDTWKMGQVPLWNPYSFSGTAHEANYQSAIFSPFNILFFVLSMKNAWSWLILLQPLLAGIFMFLYLRETHLKKVACLVGSFSFMFCGFLVVWMAYGTLGYAVLWLPLALFAIQRYLFDQRSWWAPSMLTISLTASLFSGHFQISLYVLLVVLAYLVILSMHARSWKGFIVLFLFYFGGLCIATPQVWSTMIAYQNALRSGLYVKGEVIPWQYFVTLFAPDFYGNPVTRNDWFGHYAEWSSYAGVVTLLLALWSIGRKRIIQYWFWFCVFCLAIFLAFPTYLNDILYLLKIPVLSTSSASRVIVIASFCLSVLASFGMDSLLGIYTEWKKKRLIIFSSIIILCLLLFWFVLLYKGILPADKLGIAKRNSILPTVFALAGLCLFWLTGVIKKKYIKIISLLIVCLVGFEVLRFSTKWMPFDPVEYVYPEIPIIEFLQKNVGVDRMFGNFGGELANYFSIGSLEGYDAVYSKRYGEFISYVNTGDLDHVERSIVRVGKDGKYLEQALQLLGVKYILHRVGDGRNVWAYPFWKYQYYSQIHKDNDYEVYERKNVYARVFLADHYIVGKNDKDILQKLFADNTDRRTTLILESEPSVKPEIGEGSAKIIQYTPNSIRVSVKSAVPKLLFLSDTYDEGWKVSIDGKQSPLYRADYDFRAVGVGAGDHVIVFTYAPGSVYVGFIIAFGAVVALMLGTLYLKEINKL